MTSTPGPESPVAFLYEDADLVVCDKPAGVPVIPAPGVPAGTCLRDRAAAALNGRMWVVHRLDRDTSGVVVFARSADAHRTLSMAFERRDVAKQYIALVAGTPSPSEGTIAIHLHEARRGKTRPARPDEPNARDAETRYEVTREWTSGSWTVARVAAAPLTGRHHQIRVHLKAIGTPILGDRHYGPTTVLDLPVPRLALHAARIDVPHPTAPQRRVVAESPWPSDLAALTDWLDAHWSVSS
jgi:tRNA pseudouridine32 synthase/23S rRNA pseudouridine746 synthase